MFITIESNAPAYINFNFEKKKVEYKNFEAAATFQSLNEWIEPNAVTWIENLKQEVDCKKL